jgi:hypothetical protein
MIVKDYGVAYSQAQRQLQVKLCMAIREFKTTHNMDRLTPEQDKKYWELLVAYERSNNSHALG